MIFHDVNGDAELLEKLVLNETRCLAFFEGDNRSALASGCFYRDNDGESLLFISDDGSEFDISDIKGLIRFTLDDKTHSGVLFSGVSNDPSQDGAMVVFHNPHVEPELISFAITKRLRCLALLGEEDRTSLVSGCFNTYKNDEQTWFISDDGAELNVSSIKGFAALSFDDETIGDIAITEVKYTPFKVVDLHPIDDAPALLDELIMKESRCLAMLEGCCRTTLLSGSFYRYQGKEESPVFVSDDGCELCHSDIRGISLLSFDGEANGTISFSCSDTEQGGTPITFRDLRNNDKLVSKFIREETRCLALLDGCYRTVLVSGSFYLYQGEKQPWFVSDDGGEFALSSITGVALLSMNDEQKSSISLSELSPES
jgi:hypothetical protein